MTTVNSEFLQNNNSESNVNSTCNVNGKMKLIELRGKRFNNLRRQSIEVTVYRSQIEHFVTIHSKTKNNPPVGVFKLKNTTVEILDCRSFQVRQVDGDNPTALTFLLDQPEDLEYWTTAFTENCPPTYNNDLYNITESDQEDSDQD